MTLTPARLEVIRNALVAAAEEMSITIWRTSRSTVVREILDYSTAVFDATGHQVAQAARIPVHLNSMSDCLQTLLERHFPLCEWQDGDVFVTNDPYSGGQHLSDIQTFRPVFCDGARVAIVGTLCHHVDVGGAAPGSYFAPAVEIFQEGLRIPPLRLTERGRPNTGVFDMILHNVRQPEETGGDLSAQVAALGVGAAAVARIAAKYGAAALAQAMAQIQDQSERTVRARLAALPDGCFSFEERLEGDGHGGEITLRATVTKHGDSLDVDFAGTSKQAAGPINNTPAMANSAIYYALLAAIGADIPANSGCYRPVRISLPLGSVVNATFPAPVAGRMVVNHRVAVATLGALAGLMPGRIPAPYYATSYVYALATVSATGRRQVYYDIEVGGWGGHAEGDGASALSCGMHNVNNSPIEVIEQRFPVTFQRYALLPDSGGVGQFRGGLGLLREFRQEAPEGRFNSGFERFSIAPPGIAGGGPGSLSRTTLFRADGTVEKLPAKLSGYPIRQGDIIRVETSGGGGYGDPSARDPARRQADIEQGYVT